jgi:hypothetical protein
MEKGITLQAHLHAGTEQAAVSDVLKKLPAAFAKANPGLQLKVKKASAPDAKGNVTVRVYIEGDQGPADDFSALAHTSLNKAITAMNAGARAASSGDTAPSVHVHGVKEVEDDDDDSGLVLPPKQADTSPTSSAPAQQVSSTTSPAAQAGDQPGPATAASTTQQPSPPTAQPAQQVPTDDVPWWAFWRRGHS